jgi:hypothetical protein
VNQPTRNKVVWVGSAPPSDLSPLMRGWGLELVRDVPAVAHSDPSLRAILIWHTAKTTGALRKRLNRAIGAIDHGVLVGVVAEDERSFATASDVSRPIVAGIEADTNEAFEGIFTFRLDDAKGSKWSEVARACFDCDPGPAVHSGLTIENSVGPLEKTLFQRAFAEFDRLSLTLQHGGRSGSSVWRVDADSKAGQRCEPFIAKIGPKRALQEERDTFRENVRDFIPFPFRPSMKAQGFVTGATRAMLCSMFISRAQCFDEYVCLVQYPELVVTALFDGPLRSWRSNRHMIKKKLGRIYVERAEAAAVRDEEDRKFGRTNREVLPKKDRLAPAYALAKVGNPKLATPDHVWDRLRALPAIEYADCPCHGDLNARNIFVRSTSVDVVLIDFSHAGDRSASSRDPSRLDVNLGFDVGWNGHPRKSLLAADAPKADGADAFPPRRPHTPMLTDDVLTALYTSPLLAGHARREALDGRIEAIRQIRHHAAGEGISNREYEITTACHLLRYARADGSQNTALREFGPDEERRLRKISYLLAVRLLGL